MRGSKTRPATCHPARLHYAHGLCSACYQAEHRRRNPEHTRAYARARYDHTEQRDKRLRYLFGITLADYRRMFQAQLGRCAICGTDKAGGRWGTLAVDHDHRTGIVRGLLCQSCNRCLGLIGDNPELLERAASYLRDANARTWTKKEPRK